jgi:hypothetical protein
MLDRFRFTAIPVFLVCLVLMDPGDASHEDQLDQDQAYLRWMGNGITTRGNFHVGIKIQVSEIYRNVDKLEVWEDVLYHAKANNSHGREIIHRTSISCINLLRSKLNRVMDLAQLHNHRQRLVPTSEFNRQANATNSEHVRREAQEQEWRTLEAYVPDSNFGGKDTPNSTDTDSISRNKRQVLDLVVAGIKIIGSIYGLIDKARMKRLRDKEVARVDDLYVQIAPLRSGLAATKVALADLYDDFHEAERVAYENANTYTLQQIWDLHFHIVSAQVDQVVNTMEGLLHGELHHQTLDEGEMEDTLTAVRTEARHTGYQVMVNNAAEAYQCQASFLMEGDGFFVFLHLPLAKLDDHMTIYEFVPVPMFLTDTQYLQIRPLDDIIAVDAKRTYFFTMNAAQLNACQRIGDLRLCDNANLQTRKSILDSYNGERNHHLCIWFLLNRDYAQVKQACEVHLVLPTDQGFQIGGTDFVFVSARPTVGHLICAGSLDSRQKNLEHVTRVTVPPGCTFETPHQTATGILDQSTAKSISYQWPLADPKDLLDGLQLEQHQRYLDQRQKGQRLLTDIPEIQQELARAEAYTANNEAWTIKVSTIVIGIVVLLLVVAASVGGWYLYHARIHILLLLRDFISEFRGKVVNAITSPPPQLPHQMDTAA